MQVRQTMEAQKGLGFGGNRCFLRLGLRQGWKWNWLKGAIRAADTLLVPNPPQSGGEEEMSSWKQRLNKGDLAEWETPDPPTPTLTVRLMPPRKEFGVIASEETN